MIYWEAGHIIFIILFAWLNSYLIKKGKRIYHGLNGLLFIAIAGLLAYFYWLPLFVCFLLNVRILFDGFLNKMRGLELNYIPPVPKSWADKLEKNLFGNDFYTPRIIYFVISLGINALYFIFIRK